MVLSLKLFQSTHPRRVWLIYTLYINTIYLCFNPHTHEGCDILLLEDTERKAVSIHTHEGCDRREGSSPLFLISFQSTHPRRVWLLVASPYINYSVFQSIHPRRVWLAAVYLQYHRYAVSIHTPTKGVTNGPNRFCARRYVSIHTPTKGVTSTHFSLCATRKVSIHTPTKGVTVFPLPLPSENIVSIHTPTKGVTNDETSTPGENDVSIHTPTKGVTLVYVLCSK